VLEADALWLACVALRAAVAAYYDFSDVELPARRFVSGGPAAWDCELLAVWADRTFAHAGNVTVEAPALRGAGLLMQGALFQVELLRCAPAGELTASGTLVVPTVEQEEEYAEQVYNDRIHLWNAVRQAAKNGDLPGCKQVTQESWQVVGPDGALGGGLLSVRASLEGF
jgi:hypothetical protein